MLAGAKGKWLLSGGSLQDQGVSPEAFRRGTGEAAIGGSSQGDEVLPGIFNGCIDSGQHSGDEWASTLIAGARRENSRADGLGLDLVKVISLMEIDHPVRLGFLCEPPDFSADQGRGLVLGISSGEVAV